MIHYHGTPLTPRAALHTMAGKHFCVSYADPRDADVCLQIGQSVMWDNGAFSLFTQGQDVNWNKFYSWVEPRLGHPHWAVIPDVIDGGERENNKLISEWPHSYELSAPVWHLDEPISRLLRLTHSFRKICFGSSGKYWQIGTVEWERRCDEAFNALAKEGPLPWVHMLRGLGLGGKRWPFASADSVNVARNHKDSGINPEYMAREIDAVQSPVSWNPRPIQAELVA